MLNVAIVGLGYWGPNLLRVFDSMDFCVVKYCCDKDDGVRHTYQQLYPRIVFLSEFEVILNDPDVDAVVIATPVPTHYFFAKQALSSNKHVFVEKPLTLEIEHAIELTELAEQKQLTLMVGHLMLYHPAIEWLKKIIIDGELGQICYLYSQRVNLGRLRSKENAMWSLAPHDISVALYLIGKNPNSVSANGYAYLQPDVEDVAFINLTFESKMAAHIHCSWLDPHKIRKMTVVGEKRMAVFDDMNKEEPIKIYDKGFSAVDDDKNRLISMPYVRFGDIWIPHIPAEEPLMRECKHFLDSIINSTNPISDGRNGIDVLTILHQAQDSMLQSQALSISYE
ncbi:hypothetical protein CMK18_08555 [Candidatus Poribacteria bacterium]|nr:hypothetical protein [Candidatus Poribacteria bacterium]